MTNKLSFKQSIIAGVWAAVTAAVINVILFFIYHALGIITDTIFVQPNTPMNAVQVIITSLLPTIIASMVFFLFEKYSKNGFKIFTIVSIVLLLASFANPFVAIPGVPLAYALALCTMHVVVLILLLYFIKRSIKQNLV